VAFVRFQAARKEKRIQALQLILQKHIFLFFFGFGFVTVQSLGYTCPMG
jgi:hypothetical protein